MYLMRDSEPPMKKNNLLKLLGIAFVVAIVSTGIFYGLFVTRLTSSTGGKALLVAAHALKPGVVLQAADVKSISWPGPDLPKGSFSNPSDVVGSTVFDPIGEDEPIYSSHLANPQGGGGTGVPEGMRAVSVHVTDSTGVMNLLRAGQRVDVQVVVGRTGSDKNETQVRTALEGLRVLSVSLQPEQGSQGQNLPVVTLLAKPTEADVLAAADSGARVRLTLRNPLDQESRGGGSLSLSTVMRSSGPTQKPAGKSSSPLQNPVKPATGPGPQN